ncbi:MAG TPA: ATP-dependent DNA helicase RecG [Candidatus Sulfotelmatobacter sp.]|nr:ATP-dependent DNA helicase RecG [Candidatus Sulfotelmatobacter sp.]
MELSSKITEVAGIGPSVSGKFHQLGIYTVSDLIEHFPRRYEDYSNVTDINRLKPGQVSLKAKITNARGRYVRNRLHITEAIASDSTGSVRLVWFNQPYRAESIKPKEDYYISGKFELRRGHLSINSPAIELVSDLPANTASILAVYPSIKGLDSRTFRLAIRKLTPVFSKLKETLPPDLIKEHQLLPRSEAYSQLHMPKSTEALTQAKRRLGFEEVLELSLASLLNKQENAHEKALSIPINESLAKDFINSLPFKLTDGQRISMWQSLKDLDKTEPMNRLIEGDVGSGKTVVATLPALMAMEEGHQAAFMAPTEILARQHEETFKRLLKPIGLDKRVVLLLGSLKPAEKQKALDKIKNGQAGLIVGTHALIQEKVDMHSLALVIIDEQHRFGVDQRKALMLKAGHMPHVLSLSATPIPRSLALTLYGELDISLLSEKPSGRKEVLTKIIGPAEKARTFEAIKKELDNGRQMFVVCPSISESAKLDISSAEKVYSDLSKKDFKDYRVGLIHGKLKPTDKQNVMQDFIDRKIDILVATTVIEVGVDVPNASVMLIENAERFGLAQLHQLRGRVGRGQEQGHCYLMLEDSENPSPRLRAMVSSSDGFKLAELDLEIRGPGAIYGLSQHGALDLRIVNLSDTKLISEAVKAARKLIKNNFDLSKYKTLEDRVNKLRIVTNLN